MLASSSSSDAQSPDLPCSVLLSQAVFYIIDVQSVRNLAIRFLLRRSFEPRSASWRPFQTIHRQQLPFPQGFHPPKEKPNISGGATT